MNMLGTLIPHLSTLIVTVRKNMLSSVMTTFMILVIIIAWSAKGNIAVWIENNPTAQEQQARMSRGQASDQKIEQALRVVLIGTQADRLLIRQFHEQHQPGSDVMVPMTTTTHAVMAPGVSPPQVAITTMPRSYLKDITSRVWPQGKPPACTHIKVTDITDAIYRDLLERSGVFEQYICPISDLDGAPIGVIMAGFLTGTKQRPEEAAIFAKMMDTAIRVAGYLNEVKAPERETMMHRVLSW
jgi:hypothetical protein